MGARLATDPYEIEWLCIPKSGRRDDGLRAKIYGIQDDEGNLVNPVIIASYVKRVTSAKSYSLDDFMDDLERVG